MPTKKDYSIAKDFFLYLFNTGVLYFTVVSFITLLFQYINQLIPDPLRTYYSDQVFNEPMRFAISSLIILFPVYILTARWLANDIDKHPAKKDLWVRRWLIYITLFITSVTMVVDLITLLNYFLGGDLTLRFGLKVLAVLIVAGAVFTYYLFILKRKPGEKQGLRKTLRWLTTIVVVAAIIGAFFIVGSPKTARLTQYDEQRIQDLQAISNDISFYYKNYEQLPTKLDDLTAAITYRRGQGYLDPATEQAYQYAPLSETSYQLCATFDLKSAEKTNYYDYYDWSHPAGNYCFTRELPAENDLVPPEPTPVEAY